MQQHQHHQQQENKTTTKHKDKRRNGRHTPPKQYKSCKRSKKDKNENNCNYKYKNDNKNKIRGQAHAQRRTSLQAETEPLVRLGMKIQRKKITFVDYGCLMFMILYFWQRILIEMKQRVLLIYDIKVLQVIILLLIMIKHLQILILMRMVVVMLTWMRKRIEIVKIVRV